MRQIDRLLARAGRNSEMRHCKCFLDGEDYSFWVKPLTMLQIVESQKPIRRNETPSEVEVAVQLFMLRALDANGKRIYTPDAFNILMRLPVEDINVLIGAMREEEEEETDLDLKSLNDGTEKGGSSDSRTGGSRKTKSDAK